MHTPQSMMSIDAFSGHPQLRTSYRLLISLKVFDGEPSFGHLIKASNFVLPAKTQNPIKQLLQDIEQHYGKTHPRDPKIKCDQLLIEDQFEVDQQYCVGEILNDYMKLNVNARIINSIDQSKASHTNDKNELIGKKRNHQPNQERLASLVLNQVSQKLHEHQQQPKKHSTSSGDTKVKGEQKGIKEIKVAGLSSSSSSDDDSSELEIIIKKDKKPEQKVQQKEEEKEQGTKSQRRRDRKERRKQEQKEKNEQEKQQQEAKAKEKLQQEQIYRETEMRIQEMKKQKELEKEKKRQLQEKQEQEKKAQKEKELKDKKEKEEKARKEKEDKARKERERKEKKEIERKEKEQKEKEEKEREAKEREAKAQKQKEKEQKKEAKAQKEQESEKAKSKKKHKHKHESSEDEEMNADEKAQSRKSEELKSLIRESINSYSLEKAQSSVGASPTSSLQSSQSLILDFKKQESKHMSLSKHAHDDKKHNESSKKQIATKSIDSLDLSSDNELQNEKENSDDKTKTEEIEESEFDKFLKIQSANKPSTKKRLDSFVAEITTHNKGNKQYPNMFS